MTVVVAPGWFRPATREGGIEFAGDRGTLADDLIFSRRLTGDLAIPRPKGNGLDPAEPPQAEAEHGR